MYSAKYEDYRDNVDVLDEYAVGNDEIVRNICCRPRHVNVINRRMEGVNEEPCYSHNLSAAVIGVNNTMSTSFAVPRSPWKLSRWADIDEQDLQLENKPNCYLILGKPGCSSYLLGEQLSKQYQCLHICPRNVLVDDLSQKSPVGKCIDFNMRHYNEIKMNTILPIILKKLESPVVQHRGYVLSGIPLVSANRSDMTFFNHSYSEESVLVADGVIYDLVMNIGKKKQKKKRDSDTSNSSFVSEDTLEDAGEEMNEEFPNEGVEEEDKKIELPTFLLDPCEEHIFLRKCYYGSTTVDLLHQLDTLLKVSMKPDVIIYITCPDEDVVTIRKSKYFDYINESSYIAKNNLAPGNEQRWPNKYELSEYKHPIRHQSINQPKYAVKPPINHSEKSVEQLCRYRNVVKPFLEKKLCDINPSSVINIDGRKSVSHNFYHISARLQMMPVKKVVHIPLPLYLEEADDMEEFWKSVAEKNVIKFGDTLTFNRFPSLWYQRCPVELKKRRSIKGKTKYAAAFYNHVYLLSSSDALISFWKNPRPYLNSALLEPTCRIIVMGTKSSGKSMVSECLSWLLDAPVIDYKTLYNAEKRKKYDTITESVFSDLIPVIQDARLEAWDSSETKRMADLAFWHNTALENLRKYIDAWNKIKKLEEPDSDTKAMKNFLTLKENLQFLPFIDDFDECNNALTEKDLLAFAPENLITTPEMPSVPVLGDPDVTEAINDFIISNDMQKDTEPNFEEIAKITISTIKNIDKESLEQFDTYGKYIIDGFDPNPELWEFLIEAKTLPDIVMILIENREIDDKLMKYYSKLETVRKHHRERYIQVEDPLVKIKFNSLKEIPGAVESLISTTLDIQKLFDDIIAEAIDSRIEEIDDQYEAENTMDEEISTFTQAIEKVRTDWGNTKGKLEETFISLIEVELQTNEKDKTDLTILEEVLRKLRQSFCAPCEPIEGEGEEPVSEEKETPKDLLTFNDPRHLGETGIYCPISFFEYGVLWEGKPELSIKYGNKTHFFSKEECLETFRSDWTKYQFFDKPFKKMPPWRICVMGCVGSGRTTLSKLLAKELGLLHIDFEDAVNNLLMPRHFKKVGRRYENIFTDVSLDEEQVVEFQAGEESGETQSSNVLFNELEMRRMVYDYFEKGTPLLSHLLEKLLNKLWFEHPFVDNGIVVDGFPKVSNDVEVMVNCFCIPDIVIELESSSETALARISEKMFQTWKNQQTLAKNKAKKKFAAKTAAWKEFITSNVVAKVILEDLIFEVVSLCEPQPEQAGEVSELPVDNFLSNAYDAMVEDNPPPVDESEWEDNESALERIQNRLETIYEFDDEARRVPVPDERFDYLCEYHKPASKVPAFLNVVDIAGLVRGAAEGQGLGNAFLSHIKACDAIFNLCRAFDDDEVIHVDGEVNPVRDLETISEELRLKDEEQLLQHIDKLDRVVNRGNDKKLKPEYDALMKIKQIIVDEKKHIRFADWSAAEIEVLNKYLFLTSKPALYLVNLSEKDYIRKKNKWLPKLKEWIDKNDPGAPLIPFSGVLETKLMDMDPEERKAFLKEHNITSALDKIIVQGYKALQLEYFFTAGPDEVKAWTIQKGTKAPQAAGRIHTDFEKGFIMAEVMHFKDFKEEGTEAACKAAGKYRQQGRNYVVEDGDIIFFKFNAGAGLKDAKKK